MRPTGPGPGPAVDDDRRRGLLDSPLRDGIRSMRPQPIDPLAEPAPRHPPRVEGELRAIGGGRKRAEKAAFVADVDDDGRMRFKDRPNVRVSLPCFHCMVRASADALEEWYRDPYAYTRAMDDDETMVPGRPMVRSVSHAPGTSNERGDAMVYLPIISGTYDLTDWVMRMHGEDPYQSEKLSLLDRTRDERAGMAMVAREERVRVAIRELPALLDRVWGDRRQSLAARRRLIHELRDECDDTPAGREARATIEGWMRRMGLDDDPSMR